MWQVMRGDIERAGLAVIDAGHDDQDAVGAGGAGLVNLIGIEQEILAQRGQAGWRRAPRARSSSLPWNEGPSVRTERQAAPPAS